MNTTNETPPGERRQDAATILLVIGVALALVLAYQVLRGLAVDAENGERVREVLTFQARVILVAAAVVLATASILAAMLWRLAKATLAQERFPPEGLPKLLDAQPRKGVAAIYLGRNLRRAALVSAIAGIALALSAGWFALGL
jgi:hypothetical protein